RYRHVSNQAQRQQTKWVVYGITVALVSFFGLTLFFGVLFPVEPLSELLPFTVVYLFLLCIPLSIGFAILRYRLWDIDLLINRTLVYGALTASIIGIYALVVGYFSLAFQVSGSPVVSILATGLVAVLFQPLRSRLQRLVNRLMYGERDDPYVVISRLGKLLETTMAPDAILPTTVQTVARALKLPYTAIALKQEDELVIVASYGTAKDELVHFPLVYQAEQIGELVLAPRGPSERFAHADRALLGDLARQAGVAAHAVRLTADLKRLTMTLQEAREQLITAREEERRRLRRDLHDGLGPTLGHLTLQLDGVYDLIAQDPPSAQTQVVQLKASVQEAMNDIRRLVYALRPPALDELGLVTALREQATSYQHRNGLAVTVEAKAPLPDLPAAVEVAAYRIALEALTNVVRHAQAHTCRIILTATDALILDVEDDGRGLPDSFKAGIGLLSMRERAAELGGTCVLEAGTEGGTRVYARLPFPKKE
ncbi:MAG: sensor histidine kinase, partial [Chloroflexi bacterium]|nr:sensor histidine kinase [Chloroflexota bacterium]